MANVQSHETKKGSVYQPCSGSQLTCFLGFSIGNFISNSVLSQNVEEFVQCGKRNTEKIDKSRRLLLTHLRHTMFSWMWTWVSFVRRNKRIAKPHCLPQLSPSSSAFFFSPPRLDAWCSPDRLRYL